MAQRRWWQSLVPDRWQRAMGLRTDAASLFGSVARPVPGAPEQGVSGTLVMGGIISGEEYNLELVGKRGLTMYDKMRKSDAQVRATLQVMKLPLMGATWQAIPPDGGDDIDQQIADFVNLNLFDDDGLVDGWLFTLKHILLQLDFGFSVLEIKWRVDADGQYMIERLAPRLAKTIHAWHIDRSGTLIRLWQYAPVVRDLPPIEAPVMPGRPPQPPATAYEYIPIPGEALAVFTFDREGDNLEGTSMLRSCYRNFYYKDLIYHLDGVRLDRYGVGIPVATIDPVAALSDTDMDDLENVLKDLRSNEKVYLIEPPGVSFRILTPSGGGGAAADAGSLIDHHDMMISRNVLAGFLTVSKDSQGLGSGRATSTLSDMFVNSLRGVAAGIAGDLKKSVVRPLCNLNFNMTGRQYPSVIVRDIQDNNIEGMIGVLLKAAGTLITPDDNLESMLRKALKLPPLPDQLTRTAIAADAKKTAQETALMQPPPVIVPVPVPGSPAVAVPPTAAAPAVPATPAVPAVAAHPANPAVPPVIHPGAP